MAAGLTNWFRAMANWAVRGVIDISSNKILGADIVFRYCERKALENHDPFLAAVQGAENVLEGIELFVSIKNRNAPMEQDSSPNSLVWAKLRYADSLAALKHNPLSNSPDPMGVIREIDSAQREIERLISERIQRALHSSGLFVTDREVVLGRKTLSRDAADEQELMRDSTSVALWNVEHSKWFGGLSLNREKPRRDVRTASCPEKHLGSFAKTL